MMTTENLAPLLPHLMGIDYHYSEFPCPPILSQLITWLLIQDLNVFLVIVAARTGVRIVALGVTIGIGCVIHARNMKGEMKQRKQKRSAILDSTQFRR
jgi:hypothetical protein